MYTQTITPDPDIASRPGYCLEYVRKTFGLPVVHPDATAAWEASTTKHHDLAFPAGVAVPVWYGVQGVPEGHVVLRMPDGSVYSTTDPTGSTPHHHPSLADLEAHYTAAKLPLSYRGWTEDVCGYPVITYKKEQEQFMGGFIDAGQADDIVEQTVARLLERLPAILDSKLRIHPIQAESIVQATTGRTVAQLKNDAIPRGQADDIARAAADYTVEQLAEAGKS